MVSAEAQFIAGLIDGEACFTVSRSNGGSSWLCRMDLALRDDDADLLEWVHATTGIGSLRYVPARRTSRPQVDWIVAAQDDCLALASLLTDAPLRTRKSYAFEIWRRAVEIWVGDALDRDAMLARNAAALVQSRQFREAAHPAATLPARELLWPYLAGLIAGEGHLHVDHGGPRLTIRMRADDTPLLNALAYDWGYGSVGTYDVPGANPVSTWSVAALNQVWSISRNVAPYLRGRKARELAIWTIAIDACTERRRHGRPPASLDLTWYRRRLQVVRRYVPREPRVYANRSRGRRRDDPIVALREWAREQPPSFSAVGYMAARREHPRWPHRNTITRRVGTWRRALVVAGLVENAAAVR